MSATAPAGREYRIVTLGSGVLTVVVCGLCASVVAADGEDQHDRVHTAAMRPEGDQDGPH